MAKAILTRLEIEEAPKLVIYFDKMPNEHEIHDTARATHPFKVRECAICYNVKPTTASDLAKWVRVVIHNAS